MAKKIDLKGKISGDDLRTKNTVTGIPAGQTIVKAWLTIKARKGLDTDVQAVVQKTITSGFTHTGTDPVTCAFNIDLTAAETANCKPQVSYDYDIQVKTSANLIDTPIIGQIVFEQGVTDATT